jgi:3-carboxy-cis,cis-muconate cycloisomerase
MRANISITGGLILAEAVMMALAPHTGRGAAHDSVYAACRAAADNKTELVAELRKRAEVTAYLDDAKLAEITDPANYLGSTAVMIDRALAHGRSG